MMLLRPSSLLSATEGFLAQSVKRVGCRYTRVIVFTVELTLQNRPITLPYNTIQSNHPSRKRQRKSKYRQRQKRLRLELSLWFSQSSTLQACSGSFSSKRTAGSPQQLILETNQSARSYLTQTYLSSAPWVRWKRSWAVSF